MNEIPGDEITISIFRDRRPVKLFRNMKNLGFDMEEKYKGVYYVSGVPNMPIQIIVINELEGMDSISLKILSDSPREEDILAFSAFSKTLIDKDDRENADAVLQVSIMANRFMYKELKRRYPDMNDAILDLFGPEIEEKVAKERENTNLESIKNIMEGLKCSAKQAMDLLKIPVKDQARYLKML